MADWTWNAALNRWERVAGALGLVVEQHDGRWFVVGNYTTEPPGYATLIEAQDAAERWALGVGREIVTALGELA